jgi:hypothetical protein
LELVVAAAAPVNFNVPPLKIEFVGVKKILPYQGIAVGLTGTGLRFC